MRSRAGFTLAEMMVVVVIMGAMTAIATPKIREALIRSDVRGARYAINALYQQTRIAAIQSHRPTTLWLTSDSAWVTRNIGGVEQRVGQVRKLTAEFGVTINVTSDSVRMLPTGMTNLGAGKMIKVTRSGYSDSVMISQYGRIQ